MKFFLGVVAALCSAFLAPSVEAQPEAAGYPSKPVRMVVPYGAGGGTDATARVLAEKLGPLLGQTVVIDNRAGAGGMIGTDAVAKSSGDGYTILLTNGGPIVLNPSVYSKMAYKTQDLVAVARISQVPFVLMVNSTVPAGSLKDFVAWMKQSKQPLTFASFGIGSESHLAGEYFNKLEGLTLTHVSYKGAAPALQDLAGGQVTMMFGDPGSAKGMIATGRVKAIAASGPERIRSLPNVPTFVELGYPGMADFVSWFGVFAPASTPKPVVQRLAAAIVKAVESPDVSGRLRELDQEPSPMLSDATGQLVAADTARWAKVVRDIGGVKID